MMSNCILYQNLEKEKKKEAPPLIQVLQLHPKWQSQQNYLWAGAEPQCFPQFVFKITPIIP